IGPDLCIQLAQTAQRNEIVVIADPSLLKTRARQLGLPIELVAFDPSKKPRPGQVGTLVYLASELAEPAIAGQLNPTNSAYVLQTLQLALNGCLDKLFDAVVTAPVHKAIINDAGFPFSGHTEFFAEGAGVKKVVMMLATSTLRVALATTHLPLRAVSDAISTESLLQVMGILTSGMQQFFGLDKPRIAVCGLNPHAGESGHLGSEEQTVIEPAIK